MMLSAPPELISSILAFVLMVGSATVGVYVRPRLPERHRTRETTELMQVTINLLVTFAALVLGLLTASVKQSFDHTAHDRQAYTLELSILDNCLNDFGPETTTVRGHLHSYVAAVIASTWPDEPKPTGVTYPDTKGMPRVGASPVLGAMMNRIGNEINQLSPATPFQQRTLAMCSDRFRQVLAGRLGVIEDARHDLFEPFYGILIFWLMIMFACFGLLSPINGVTAITVLLCATSLSSVIYVIVDLSRPYDGLFSLASEGMREALAAMLHLSS
jgi:hypothetical protein